MLLSDVSGPGGALKFAFINGRVAIVIRYWEQRGDVTEAGARIDIRRVTQVEGQAHRHGAAGATIHPVGGGGGIWRADLFVGLEEGTGCFHYHPAFRDNDVGDRFDDEGLAEDPRGWIETRLRDLPDVLAQAGARELIPSVDMDNHLRAMPLMMAAVDAALAQVPITSAHLKG